jgi:hypothetical protein
VEPAPWCIENPVSTLGSYWRKPDFSLHPHEFGGWPGGSGDDYRKRTCLWTGGGFRFPEKREIRKRRVCPIRFRGSSGFPDLRFFRRSDVILEGFEDGRERE